MPWPYDEAVSRRLFRGEEPCRGKFVSAKSAVISRRSHLLPVVEDPGAVEQYLASVSEPAQTTLRALRQTLRELMPDAIEGMSYAMPCFAENGQPVAGYFAWKKHCSYYPHSGSILSALGERVAGYNQTRAALHFPLDEPLAPDIVAMLVEAKREQLAG